MSSPIIKHFFGSLFARCRIRTRFAQSARSFHSQESTTGERCIMVMCPYGKVVVPRLVGQEDKRKKHGARPDRSERLLGALGIWMSGRTTKKGSDPCATEMSLERGKGESDLCLKAARCHKRVLVNEARCGEALTSASLWQW